MVKLYAAALIPGLLLAGLYMVYVVTRVVMNPSLAPKLPKEAYESVSWGQVFMLLVKAFVPLAVLILSVLGAILFGLATPSEAAAIGALGGVLLAAAYRALTWDRLKEAVFLTARTTAMVCWLFVGSWTFSSVFSYLGGEGLIKDFVLSMDLNTITFLLLSQLIIFLLGWPLEWSEIIIIFVPIFLPLLPHFNVDPMFFGILIALNLQTSFLTPPMAMSAYLPERRGAQTRTTGDHLQGLPAVPEHGVRRHGAVYVFPQLVYWLPDLLYGN